MRLRDRAIAVVVSVAMAWNGSFAPVSAGMAYTGSSGEASQQQGDGTLGPAAAEEAADIANGATSASATKDAVGPQGESAGDGSQGSSAEAATEGESVGSEAAEGANDESTPSSGEDPAPSTVSTDAADSEGAGGEAGADAADAGATATEAGGSGDSVAATDESDSAAATGGDEADASTASKQGDPGAAPSPGLSDPGAAPNSGQGDPAAGSIDAGKSVSETEADGGEGEGAGISSGEGQEPATAQEAVTAQPEAAAQTALEYKLRSVDGHAYVVRLTAGEGAGIPADAKLEVTEVVQEPAKEERDKHPEAYEDRPLKTEAWVTEAEMERRAGLLSEALGTTEDDHVAWSKYLQVRVVAADGSEVRPAAPVAVEVETDAVAPEVAPALEAALISGELEPAATTMAPQVTARSSRIEREPDGKGGEREHAWSSVVVAADRLGELALAAVASPVHVWKLRGGDAAVLAPRYGLDVRVDEAEAAAPEGGDLEPELGITVTADPAEEVPDATSGRGARLWLRLSAPEGTTGALSAWRGGAQLLAPGSPAPAAVAPGERVDLLFDPRYSATELVSGDVALAGALPEGAEADVADRASDFADPASIAGGVAPAEGERLTTVAAYDIAIEVAGEAYVPDESRPVEATVSSSAVAAADPASLEVWRVGEAGATAVLSSAAPGSVSFDASEPGTYLVVERAMLAGTVTASDGRTYEVSVTYGPEAAVPAGSSLSVRELPGDESAPYEEGASGALGGRGLTYFRAFDISIVGPTGAEVKPQAEVEVSIRLADDEVAATEGDPSVLHFAGGPGAAPDVIEPDTAADPATPAADPTTTGADGTAPGDAATPADATTGTTLSLSAPAAELTFSTASFSVYAVAYTVDFHWGGETHSIPGGTTIFLGEVIDLLSITDFSLVDVESVTFSDPMLVEVEEVQIVDAEPELYETDTTEMLLHHNHTDWRLLSLAPFSSDETLVVTLKSGGTVEIPVTDAQVAGTLQTGRRVTAAGVTYTLSNAGTADGTAVVYAIADGCTIYDEVTYNGKTYEVIEIDQTESNLTKKKSYLDWDLVKRIAVNREITLPTIKTAPTEGDLAAAGIDESFAAGSQNDSSANKVWKSATVVGDTVTYTLKYFQAMKEEANLDFIFVYDDSASMYSGTRLSNDVRLREAQTTRVMILDAAHALLDEGRDDGYHTRVYLAGASTGDNRTGGPFASFEDVSDYLATYKTGTTRHATGVANALALARASKNDGNNPVVIYLSDYHQPGTLGTAGVADANALHAIAPVYALGTDNGYRFTTNNATKNIPSGVTYWRTMSTLDDGIEALQDIIFDAIGYYIKDDVTVTDRLSGGLAGQTTTAGESEGTVVAQTGQAIWSLGDQGPLLTAGTIHTETFTATLDPSKVYSGSAPTNEGVSVKVNGTEANAIDASRSPTMHKGVSFSLGRLLSDGTQTTTRLGGVGFTLSGGSLTSAKTYTTGAADGAFTVPFEDCAFELGATYTLTQDQATSPTGEGAANRVSIASPMTWTLKVASDGTITATRANADTDATIANGAFQLWNKEHTLPALTKIYVQKTWDASVPANLRQPVSFTVYGTAAGDVKVPLPAYVGDDDKTDAGRAANVQVATLSGGDGETVTTEDGKLSWKRAVWVPVSADANGTTYTFKNGDDYSYTIGEAKLPNPGDDPSDDIIGPPGEWEDVVETGVETETASHTGGGWSEAGNPGEYHVKITFRANQTISNVTKIDIVFLSPNNNNKYKYSFSTSSTNFNSSSNKDITVRRLGTSLGANFASNVEAVYINGDENNNVKHMFSNISFAYNQNATNTSPLGTRYKWGTITVVDNIPFPLCTLTNKLNHYKTLTINSTFTDDTRDANAIRNIVAVGYTIKETNNGSGKVIAEPEVAVSYDTAIGKMVSDNVEIYLPTDEYYAVRQNYYKLSDGTVVYANDDELLDAFHAYIVGGSQVDTNYFTNTWQDIANGNTYTFNNVRKALPVTVKATWDPALGTSVADQAVKTNGIPYELSWGSAAGQKLSNQSVKEQGNPTTNPAWTNSHTGTPGIPTYSVAGEPTVCSVTSDTEVHPNYFTTVDRQESAGGVTFIIQNTVKSGEITISKEWDQFFGSDSLPQNVTMQVKDNSGNVLRFDENNKLTTATGEGTRTDLVLNAANGWRTKVELPVGVTCTVEETAVEDDAIGTAACAFVPAYTTTRYAKPAGGGEVTGTTASGNGVSDLTEYGAVVQVRNDFAHIARVSNDGGNTWTYHDWLINDEFQEGSTEVYKGAFNQANSHTGSVVIETLREGWHTEEGAGGEETWVDDTIFEGETTGRYTLTGGVTFSKNLTNITLRTMDGLKNASTLTRGYSGGNLFTVNTAATTLTVQNITMDGDKDGARTGMERTGRGIDLETGTLNILDGTTMRNFKSDHGSAIFAAGNAQNTIIENALFSTCEATTNSGTEGGGAVHVKSKAASIKGTTFVDCVAKNRGGALFTYPNDGVVYTIDNCTFIGHEKLDTSKPNAGEGGGYYVWNGSPTVTNTTFIDCYTTGSGGAMNMDGGGSDRLVMRDCKFYGHKNLSQSIKNSGGAGGGLYINANSGIALSNLELYDCVSNGSGGGVYSSDGGAVLSGKFICENCRSENESGGGLYLPTPSGEMVDSEFTNCYAKSHGGGAYLTGGITVKNSTITDCRCTGGYGGGMYLGADGKTNTFIGCTFIGHDTLDAATISATYGGAIYVSTASNSSLALTNTTFDKYSVSHDGGAIYIENAGSLTVNGGSFTDCKAGTGRVGGVIYAKSKTVSVSDCTFLAGTTQNDAVQTTKSGGAIYQTNASGSLSIADSDFYGFQSTADGGAIWHNGSGPLTADNVSFTQSKGGTANSGGVIYTLSSNVTLRDATFLAGKTQTETVQTAKLGGAVYQSNTAGSMSLVRTDIYGYQATASGGQGGAVWSNGHTMYFEDSEIMRCRANTIGGGVYSEARTVGIHNSLVITQNGIDNANVTNAGGAYFKPEDTIITVTSDTGSAYILIYGNKMSNGEESNLHMGIAAPGIEVRGINTGDLTGQVGVVNPAVNDRWFGRSNISQVCGAPTIDHGTLGKEVEMFKDDTNKYFAKYQGALQVRLIWAPLPTDEICKITDADGKLLYYDFGDGDGKKEAVFYTLADAFGAFGEWAADSSTFTRVNGTTAVKPVNIEMLVTSYTQAMILFVPDGTSAETLPLTLKTAPATAPDGLHPGPGSVCTITRGDFGGSMYVMDGSDDFTVSSITLDGGSKTNATYNQDGGIIRSDGADCQLALVKGDEATGGFDSTLQNSMIVNHHGGAVYMANGGSFAMDGAIIKGCRTETSGKNGGGVYLAGSSHPVTKIKDATFSNCYAAGSGGSVFSDAENLTVEGSTFVWSTPKSNSAGSNGGMIYVSNQGKNLTVTDSTFTNFRASSGGAIYSDAAGVVDITGGSFARTQDNYYGASSGGAVFINRTGAVLNVTDSTFSHVRAGSVGGAIYANKGVTVNLVGTGKEAAMFDRCFQADSGDGNRGGAVFMNENSVLNAKDLQIKDCHAGYSVSNDDFSGLTHYTGRGGGIALAKGATATLDNVSITGCSAYMGGAIYSENTGANALTLKNGTQIVENMLNPVAGTRYSAGGVYMTNGGVITLGATDIDTDSVTISGNTTASGEPANLRLSSESAATDADNKDNSMLVLSKLTGEIHVVNPGSDGDQFGTKDASISDDVAERIFSDLVNHFTELGRTDNELHWKGGPAVWKITDADGRTLTYNGEDAVYVMLKKAFDDFPNIPGAKNIELFKPSFDVVGYEGRGTYMMETGIAYPNKALDVTLKTASATAPDGKYPYMPEHEGDAWQRALVLRGNTARASSMFNLSYANNKLSLTDIVLDGQWDKSQFTSSKGGAVFLANVKATLTMLDNSAINHARTTDNGGGVYVSANATLDIKPSEDTEARIEGCQATSGGGVCSEPAFTLNENVGDVVFKDCYASGGHGGGVYAIKTFDANNNEGSISFVGCHTAGGNHDGGAIYSTGAFKMEDNRGSISFEGCYTNGGSAEGGAVLALTTFTLKNTGAGTAIFERCYTMTGSNGGAVYAHQSNPAVTIEGTAENPVTFTGCYATGGGGGAIYQYAAAPMALTNVTFGGYRTDESGNVIKYRTNEDGSFATDAGGGYVVDPAGAPMVDPDKACRSTGDGGAVRAVGALTYTNSTGGEIGFYGCKATAGAGGGIRGNAAVTLVNSDASCKTVFLSCESNGSGGGISSGGAFVLNDHVGTLVFDECYAKGHGGGIHSGGTFTANNNEGSISFVGCHVSGYNCDGGGVYSTSAFKMEDNRGSISFEGCYTNGGSAEGGAVLALTTFALKNTGAGTAIFERCYTMTGSNGGAVYAHQSNPAVTIEGTAENPVTFTGCYATGGGGGAIWQNAAAPMALTNVTFGGYRADEGGNVIKYRTNADGSFATDGAGDHIVDPAGAPMVDPDKACRSTGNGGAVYASGTLTYTNTTGGEIGFYGCKTTGGAGGGVYGASAVTLNNQSADDSIMFNACSATGDGGAIYSGGVFSMDDNPGAITFDTCETFNTDHEGGAVYANNNFSALRNAGTILFDTCRTGANTSSSLSSEGGAVFYTKDFSISNVDEGQTSFIACSANGSAGGGAICGWDGTGNKLSIAGTAKHPVRFEGCTNTCGKGGAIYVNSGSFEKLEYVSFKNCAAPKSTGGALHVKKVPTTTTFSHLMFDGNTASTNGGSIYLECDLVMEDTVIQNGSAQFGSAIYLVNSKTLNLNGGLSGIGISIGRNTATKPDGGAINVGGNGAKVFFNGNVVVQNNSCSADATGKPHNMVLNQDVNTVIQTKDNLGPEAMVGVYVTGEDRSNTIFYKHGKPERDFGTFDSALTSDANLPTLDENLAHFVNDRLNLTGTANLEGGKYLIRWSVGYVCKLTDDEGNILYRDRYAHKPAVFKTVKEGVEWACSSDPQSAKTTEVGTEYVWGSPAHQLYAADRTAYACTEPIQLKLLTDITLAGGDTAEFRNAARAFTVTTAGTAEDTEDNYPYIPVAGEGSPYDALRVEGKDWAVIATDATSKLANSMFVIDNTRTYQEPTGETESVYKTVYVEVMEDVLDGDGNVIGQQPKTQPKLDDEGNPVLNGEGNPVMEPVTEAVQEHVGERPLYRSRTDVGTLTVSNLVLDGTNQNMGSNNGAAFRVTASKKATLNDVTFQNLTSAYGGAIYVKNDIELHTAGDVKFDTCATTAGGGAGEPGGGAINVRGVLELVNESDGKLTFDNCVANGQGGALNVYMNGTKDYAHTARIENNGTIAFNNCKASTDAGALGVQENNLTIDNRGSFSFTDCTLSHEEGGAISIDAGALTIRNAEGAALSFTRCETLDTSYGKGGAIYAGAIEATENDGQISFDSCKAGTLGGAIYQASVSNSVGFAGELRVSATHAGGFTITGCESKDHGGGIYAYSAAFITGTVPGAVSISDCTSGNRGGALYVNSSASITGTDAGAVSITGCKSNDRGGAIHVITGKSLTLNGGSSGVGIRITGNTTNDAGGGAINAGNGTSRLYFAGNVLVYANSSELAGQQRNVMLNADGNEVINTTADGLGPEALIGVHVVDAQFEKHGRYGKDFGTYDDTAAAGKANLDHFVNDRNGYLGEEHTEGATHLIRWGSAVCKLTDADGELLYYIDANGFKRPAVYQSIKAGFAATGGSTTLYRLSDGGAWEAISDSSHIQLKMLRDVTMEGDDKEISYTAERALTFTTAEVEAGTRTEKVPYNFAPHQAEEARATITRGYDGKSMLTVDTTGSLTTTNVVLDGNRSRYGANTAGGIVNVAAGTLDMGEGAILRNSRTTGNGGAVYVAKDAEMAMSAGTIAGNTAVLGAGIYLPEGARLELSGSPSFGTGNEVSGETAMRQDIYIAGYLGKGTDGETPKPAESVVVTGPLACAEGAIWVAAEERDPVVEDNHYDQDKQFAQFDRSLLTRDEDGNYTAFDPSKMSDEQLAATLAAFTNAHNGQYHAAKGEVAYYLYWDGIHGSRKVILKKVDAADNKPLAGAEFRVYNSSWRELERPETDPGTYKSDEAGVYFVGDLDYGTYYLVETKFPTGYAPAGYIGYSESDPATWLYYKLTVGDPGDLVDESEAKVIGPKGTYIEGLIPRAA